MTKRADWLEIAADPEFWAAFRTVYPKAAAEVYRAYVLKRGAGWTLEKIGREAGPVVRVEVVRQKLNRVSRLYDRVPRLTPPACPSPA